MIKGKYMVAFGSDLHGYMIAPLKGYSDIIVDWQVRADAESIKPYITKYDTAEEVAEAIKKLEIEIDKGA